jgi:hypothetical protein
MGPLGSGTPGVRSMGCLTWKCRGTPAGEVNMSSYSSMTLSIYCFHAAGPCLEVMATVFLFPSGRIIRKTNFLVLEMSLLHCFAVTKKMVVGGAISGILYNLLQKVIITA